MLQEKRSGVFTVMEVAAKTGDFNKFRVYTWDGDLVEHSAPYGFQNVDANRTDALFRASIRLGKDRNGRRAPRIFCDGGSCF